MRMIPLVLVLAGCPPEPEPETGALAAFVDGERWESDPLDLGTARAHTTATSRTIEVRNVGRADVDLSGVQTPAGVLVVASDMPLVLGPGDSVEFTLSLALDTDHVIDGDVVLAAERAEVALPVVGRVTPWVLRALEDRPDVVAALDAEIARQGLVGLGVGVARGDTIVFLKGFGWEDEAAQIPVDPDVTAFRWASLSKGLTGVAAVQAEQRGLLSLDDEVSTWVDGYTVPETWLDGCDSRACEEPIPEGQRHVTVRDLLRHLGGAQHYDNGAAFPVPFPLLSDNPQTNTGIVWALDLWIDAPLVTIPGTEYNYSTMGFNLAGAAVEAAAERPFGEVVVDWIGAPLSMRSLANDKKWEDIPHRAVGYVRDGDLIREDGDNDVSWKAPGGGFLSTPADLTRYCAGLQGEVLMTHEVRDGVLWATSAPSTGYALGFGVNGSRTVISHTGSQQKSKTAVAWVPGDDLCFTVMTNSTWADPWDVLTVLRNAWNTPARGAVAWPATDPTPEP